MTWRPNDSPGTPLGMLRAYGAAHAAEAITEVPAPRPPAEETLAAVRWYATHGGLRWGQVAGFARVLNESLPRWSRESCYRQVELQAAATGVQVWMRVTS